MKHSLVPHVIARNRARLSVIVDIIIKPARPSLASVGPGETILAMKNDVSHRNNNPIAQITLRTTETCVKATNEINGQPYIISRSLICLKIPIIRSFPDQANLEVARMIYELYVTGIDINCLFLLISRWSKEISPTDTGRADKWRVSAAAFSLTSVKPRVRAGLSGSNDKSKEQRLHPVVRGKRHILQYQS